MKPYDKELGQLKLILNKNIAITVFEIEKSARHVIECIYYNMLTQTYGRVYGSCNW
jgi:hypothetical protein